jgi:7-cyano-7-deazaguanine synthase
MKLTIVPNRNMLLLATAGAYALSRDTHTVAYAAHAGDHTIYPDCRPQFVSAMQLAFERCDFTPLTLHAPFLSITKADIVTLGASLHVPFALTYSCYEGREAHCGRCGTCTERKEAFQLAGVPDPTEYEE